jgi:hypothetical protein
MPTWKKKKKWCLWTSEICYNIKVCLLNVKDRKNITSKMFCYLFTKYNQNGQNISYIRHFWIGGHIQWGQKTAFWM